MPVYNLANYVEASIRSALDQIDVCLELIVVDDASTDTSLMRIRAIKDPRLHVLTLEINQGVANARNYALSHARGEWIQFLDPDDTLDPGKLAAQLEFEPHADVIVCNWREREAESRHVSAFKPVFDFRHDVFGQILEMNRFPIHAALVRRNIVQNVGAFDPTVHHEDWDLWLKVAAAGARFRYSPDASVDYLIRNGSRSGALAQRLERDLAYLETFPRAGIPHAPEAVGRAQRIRYYHLALNAYVTGRHESAEKWLARCQPLTAAEVFELSLAKSPLTAWIVGRVPGPRKIGRLLRGLSPVIRK